MIDTQEYSNNELVSGLWSEIVLIGSKDYEILGSIFMPKIEYRTTLLSNEERFFQK